MAERDLRLSPRVEGTRDKRQSEVIKFEIAEIKQHFDENIYAIESQFAVADYLVTENKKAEAENIWRSQIVFLDSALDFYLHELTKFGLMKIYDREWDITEKYSNIQVKMDIVEQALENIEDSTWFIEFINAVYSSETMVSFDSVKDQMNLIGFEVKEIADKAFYERGSREKTVEKFKRRITELYNRRNLIAHQSDREHKDAVKKDVSKDIVLDFIQDIKKIVEAIHNVALEKV